MKIGEKFEAAKIPGARLLLVVAPYYQAITAQMETGAAAAAAMVGAKLEKFEVPGAFEIPGAIAAAAQMTTYEGFVALGCVVRGETSHYDYVCGESARGLMDLTIREGISIGYGILTVNTLAQAEERADPNRGDKGGEAVRAVAAMIALKRRLTEIAQ